MRLSLVSAYDGVGNIEQKRAAIGKAIEVDPSQAVAYSKRGHALTFLGMYGEAVSELEG